MKKALVIGIDDYPGRPLACCVNDAMAVAQLLQANEDGSPNFDVQLLTTPDSDVSNRALKKAISQFFKSSTATETAVLYFAGHGIIDPDTDSGHIVGADCRAGEWGMCLAELLKLASKAYPTIGSSVIILDCCHAGNAGESMDDIATSASVIGKGVTILTSCNNDETAKEQGQHGIFTDLLLDALGGACADIRGNITPASIYAHIDQIQGAHDQRPLYKANVQRFVTLRQAIPVIPPDVLRKLPVHFPDPDEAYRLDPSYEPDRENVPEQFRHIPVNPEHASVFWDLQRYNRQGLVVPVDVKDIYSAAMVGRTAENLSRRPPKPRGSTSRRP